MPVLANTHINQPCVQPAMPQAAANAALTSWFNYSPATANSRRIISHFAAPLIWRLPLGTRSLS